ncbi:IclR family transcriptional regulator [Zavarzinia compransoris]|uniref:IclR family transcriptional regulator n=1 Tax=Zavarzinia compransoris TaxID=1264899 RepID=A0A317DY63_9PROT|nr:IclR family transcriptional regulator [Zavarzinia compransoris]PWR19668.1 IclR family transcriptional regulator [Zavarzinia compransoris]TDP43388.1 IclR family transcriptional regulator [Zavarzinia compransoris]
MKNDPESGTLALDRALALFAAVLRDRGRTSLAEIARAEHLPVSTAHRLIAAFERQRLIARGTRGRYIAGMGLLELTPDRRHVLAQASRPVLRKLARAEKRTAHLGILEAEMVTYLVKEAGGPASVFTREMIQFEAYCTGIGKVLLAGLEPAHRDRYLAGGPFVRLTPTTITDPGDLRRHLADIAARGFAIDDAEMADGLHCVAVPVRDGQRRVIAAISLSSTGDADDEALFAALKTAAARIEARLYPG